MSTPPSATAESIDPSIPQVRLATQAEEWSTQLPGIKTAAIGGLRKTCNANAVEVGASCGSKNEKRVSGDDCRKERTSFKNEAQADELFPPAGPTSVCDTTQPVAPDHGCQSATRRVGTKQWLRKRSKVPQDQREILEDSSSHYPPLPGRDMRCGAIPVKLFDAFSAQADEAPRTKAANPTRDAGQDLCTSATPVNGTAQADAESDQEVTASQWPASPERKPRNPYQSPQQPDSSRPPSLSPVAPAYGGRRLPPDSPTFRPAQDQVQLPSDSPPLSSNSQNFHTTDAHTGLREGQSSASDSFDEDDSEDRSAQASSHTSSIRRTQIVPKSRPTTDSQERPRHSTHENASISPTANPRSSASNQAQPSPDLLVQVKRTPHPGQRGSSHRSAGHNPTSTFIPSTYQETTNRDLKHRTLLATTGGEPAADTNDVFGPEEPLETTRAPQSPQRELNESEAEVTARIAREAREYRRGVLRPISKRSIPLASDMHIAVDSAKDQSHTTGLAVSAMITPERHLQRRMEGTNLFQRFCNAYPDYHGSSKQFDGACKLLSKESASKRLHPFLLDDFVFHYTQSYLSYFTERHTSGEEPLPYSDYFDSIAPTHMKKVMSFSNLPQQTSPGRDGGSLHAPPSRASVRSNDSELANIDEQRDPQKPYQGARIELNSEPIQPDFGDAPVATTKKHLVQSQHSSVEEWLQHTICSRAESPELGTPNIDRSLDSCAGTDATEHLPRSLKRSCPADGETSSRQKSFRHSTAGVPSSTNRQSYTRPAPGPRLSLLEHFISGTSSMKLPSSPAMSLTGPSHGQKRTLPPSFSSVKKRSNDGPPASTAQTAPRLPAVSAPPRRSLGSQPLRPLSKPLMPPRPSVASSIPLKLSSTRGSSVASNIKQPKPSTLQPETTAFQRFAASWEKLADERAARESRERLRTEVNGKRVNPYALIDVTQWRR